MTPQRQHLHDAQAATKLAALTLMQHWDVSDEPAPDLWLALKRSSLKLDLAEHAYATHLVRTRHIASRRHRARRPK